MCSNLNYSLISNVFAKFMMVISITSTLSMQNERLALPTMLSEIAGAIALKTP